MKGEEIPVFFQTFLAALLSQVWLVISQGDGLFPVYVLPSLWLSKYSLPYLRSRSESNQQIFPPHSDIMTWFTDESVDNRNWFCRRRLLHPFRWLKLPPCCEQRLSQSCAPKEGIGTNLRVSIDITTDHYSYSTSWGLAIKDTIVYDKSSKILDMECCCKHYGVPIATMSRIHACVFGCCKCRCEWSVWGAVI